MAGVSIPRYPGYSDTAVFEYAQRIFESIRICVESSHYNVPKPYVPSPKPIGKGGRGRVQGKREGLWEYWEKVQVLWICRGVGVVPSRVIRDEYRI